MTGPHGIPALTGCTAPASTVTYPFTPSTVQGCDFAGTWGIDNQLKTPYAYALDFSLQRELRAGFTVEANYVGRLGRHLLEQLDLAEPVNLVDAKGGGDYFTAARQLSKRRCRSQSRTEAPAAATATAPVHVAGPSSTLKMSSLTWQALDFVGETATDGLYNNEWAPYRYNGGGETIPAGCRLNCSYGCPNGTQFFSQQFSSLYAWSSIGTSSYHALQVILRHPSSHGLTVDFNYTLSKSLDIGSGAERSNEYATDAYGRLRPHPEQLEPQAEQGRLRLRHPPPDHSGLGLCGACRPRQGGSGQLQPPPRRCGGQLAVVGPEPLGQRPALRRFRARLHHQLAAGGLWASSRTRARSRSIGTWSTAFRRSLPATATPSTTASYTGSPIRLPYPGEAGQRNAFRGDGYFDIDSSLTKNWALPDHQAEVCRRGLQRRQQRPLRRQPVQPQRNLTQGNLRRLRRHAQHLPPHAVRPAPGLLNPFTKPA
jgi:hypothetical protein